MLVCLMPLSKYKAKGLYKHVDSFELADSKLFEDAVITENLCICIVKKDEINKYDYTSMRELTFDKAMAEYYKWNIKHNKNLFMARRDYKSYNLFDKSLDFVDTSRCMDSISHGYFSKGTSFGYLWNTGKDGYQENWGAKLGVIHFGTHQAKENFQKFAYNWTTDKYDCLASKALRSLKAAAASSEYYFAIPQIDWENIHINQKELWDKGDYDNAVLAEMGLKFDEKGVIVKC